MRATAKPVASSYQGQRRPIRDGLRTWGPRLGVMVAMGWAGSRAVLAYARILLEEREHGPR